MLNLFKDRTFYLDGNSVGDFLKLYKVLPMFDKIFREVEEKQ